MPELIGLEGVKRDRVPCKMVKSITQAMTVTRALATASASDNGAISVWIDDAGNHRADFTRLLSTKGSFTGNKKGLRSWLKIWWPQMN